MAKSMKISARIAMLASDGTKLAQAKQATQGRLGLQVQDLNSQMAQQLGIDADHGVVIANVAPGSPADRASL